MIQDLDGATSEPSRRGHLIGLSAAAAIVSLVLLVALLMPAPRMDTRPLAAAPAPSPMGGTVMTIASGPSVALDQALRNDLTSTECAAGIGSNPPVHLVLDGNGRVAAAYTSGRTGRFIPLSPAYVSSGWLAVPCDTSDVFAPRMNRAR